MISNKEERESYCNAKKGFSFLRKESGGLLHLAKAGGGRRRKEF